MGRPKVYGKKTRAISLVSYTRFAADSSGNETSPEGSVLREVNHNVRLVVHATSTRLQDIKHVSQPTQLNEGGKPHGSPSKKEARPQKKSCQYPPIHQATNVFDIILLHNQSTPNKCSSRPISPGKMYDGVDGSQNVSPHPCRNSRSQVKTCQEDDLSTLFTSLRLNNSPEASILIPASPPRVTTLGTNSISSKIKLYLDPILSCKNVSATISNFSSWMDERRQLILEKVGEGSFGEVFRATSPDGRAVILKLMPLNAQKGRGSKSFTSIASAANEIRLLERMQRVPGFVEFRGAAVLIGQLPKRFMDLWKEYESSGRTVESRDPSKKTSYVSDQLWLLLEMSDAGRNLEPGQYAPPGETAIKGGRYLGTSRTWDIFWEVVKSVAKAECWAQFEHRDLHLGNVCAKDSSEIPDQEDLTFVSTKTQKPFQVNKSGLIITIIDYSLSRAFMENEDDVLFYDFRKDRHILKGEGDLQYDMYRYMAAAIGERSPREYVPQTNVVWLWYLLNRLLGMTKELTVRAKAKKRGHITRETRMFNILEEVQILTDPKHMQHWEVDSAAALLGIGIERGWISSDDVIE